MQFHEIFVKKDKLIIFFVGLNLAVGTSTGHILLYDIRSSRPLLVKDHLYGTPIKSLIFHSTLDQVISLDSKAVKIWDRLTGQPYTSIGINFKTHSWPENLKKARPKNSSNEMNQFHGIFHFLKA